MGFLFCFFAGIVGSRRRPKYPQKNTNPNIWPQKKKEIHSLKARQGHIKHVCKFSGSISQKRGGYSTLKEFGDMCLNQLVPTWYSVAVVVCVCGWVGGV